MPVEIKMTTPMSEIDKYLEEAEEEILQAVEDAIVEAVKEAIDEARANGAYQDQTGNLRSSIGGAVGRNGEVRWVSDFNMVLGGAEGAVKGRALAESVIASHPEADFCATLVAGEDYAIYVQALHGLDVLASGEALLRELLETTIPIKMEEVKV